MPKFENQTRLIKTLRTFTGKMPPFYANEKEFFLTSFNNMTEYLADLQKETLKDRCDSFIRKIDTGKFTLAAIDEFKAEVDRLISAADFKMVCASMAGSKEFIKKRLSTLAPISMVSEEKKAFGRDPEAERLIKETYSRLNFAALVKKVEAEPDDLSVNAVMSKAREEITDYCCLYRVPLGEEDTLTPYSLSCVDAALAASYRLVRNLSHAAGRII